MITKLKTPEIRELSRVFLLIRKIRGQNLSRTGLVQPAGVDLVGEPIEAHRTDTDREDLSAARNHQEVPRASSAVIVEADEAGVAPNFTASTCDPDVSAPWFAVHKTTSGDRAFLMSNRSQA